MKMDEFESDEPVEIDVAEKPLSDYHLFALLCWRNFATLPEMTLIESVQRVLRSVFVQFLYLVMIHDS